MTDAKHKSNLVDLSPQAFVKLSPSALKLYLVLMSHCGINNFYKTSVARLNYLTGMSAPTLYSAREELVKEKLVAYSVDSPKIQGVISDDGGKTLYEICPIERSKFRQRFDVVSTLQLYNGIYQSIHDTQGIRVTRQQLALEPHKVSARTRRKKSLPTILRPKDEAVLYKKACDIMEIKHFPYSRIGGNHRKLMKNRLREGYTQDDLITACRFAMVEWKNGNKWGTLKDLVYVWGKGINRILAAEGEYGHTQHAPTFRDSSEFKKELQEREKKSHSFWEQRRKEGNCES